MLYENYDDFKLYKTLNKINTHNNQDMLKENLLDNIKNAKNNFDKTKLFYGFILLWASVLGYKNISPEYIKKDIIINKNEITREINNVNDDEDIIELAEKYIKHALHLDNENPVKTHTNLKNPLDLYISNYAKKLIKHHEGSSKEKGKPVLTAYKLGDGRITVGWGHAKKYTETKLKPGQKITKEKAIELFNKDLHVAEQGVKRIFKEWEKNGINVKITQSMYDALVSIAFNTGVQSVRNSDFIQDIKNKQFKSAAEKIKQFKTSSRFPGLQVRRHDEYKLFIKDHKPIEKNKRA